MKYLKCQKINWELRNRGETGMMTAKFLTLTDERRENKRKHNNKYNDIHQKITKLIKLDDVDRRRTAKTKIHQLVILVIQNNNQTID